MGLPAARITDLTSHISLVGALCGIIGASGMPSAAMVGAMAGAMALQIPTGLITAPCFPPVIVGFLPSARVLDLHICALDVLIGGPVVVFPVNIEGDIEFVKKVQAAMATLYSTPSGKAILAGIAGKGNTVTIVPTADANGYCTPNNQADAMNPAKGTSSKVEWNPNHTTAGDPTSTSTIILGHELVHAYHNGTGTAQNGPHESYSGQSGTSNRGEERATVGTGGTSVVAPDGTTQAVPDHSRDVPTENSIRDDLGVARRPTYYPPSWPGGPPW